MRRTLGLLGLLLLTAGRHGGHGHHGGGSGMGCGGSAHAPEIVVTGTVRVDAHDQGRAVIGIRRGSVAVTGKQVRVQGQLLVELGPGNYVGPVDGLQAGAPVVIVADDRVLRGSVPERADHLVLQAGPRESTRV